MHVNTQIKKEQNVKNEKNGYEMGNDGSCIDSTRCLEKKDAELIRCIEEESEFGNTYCANKIF